MKNSRSKRFGIGFWLYFALFFCGAGMAFGADWPQWGGTPARNMVATGVGKLPCWFSPGVTDDQGGIKPGTAANVQWVAPVRGGYPSPAVSQGRIIIGDLLCLDLATGNLLWRGAKDVQGGYGYGATPTIDGDRVYTVTRKGIVLCLDLYADKKGRKAWSFGVTI